MLCVRVVQQLFSTIVTLEVINCNFTGNSATFGGVFVNYGNIDATSSNFSNNTAMNWGGVIFNYNTVKINFSSLIGNNANMGNDLYNSIGANGCITELVGF